MNRRQRWPVRNTDEMTRHLVKQFPELSRHQVAGVITAFLVAVRETCLEQWRTEAKRPGVTLRGFGRFELVHRRARLNQFGGHEVPGRWALVLRPKSVLKAAIHRATQPSPPTSSPGSTDDIL